MGSVKQRGFTIIEVSLFVAISGLLAVLLMTGWTTRVNTERYRDSVVTVQSFLQQQYNLVYNVENEHGELGCGATGVVKSKDESSAGDVKHTGQSECLLLGRYITVDSSGDGTSFTVAPITGVKPATDPDTDATLQQVLVGYQVNPVALDVQLGISESELDTPWGAKIDKTKSTFSDADKFYLAIIRSPIDGTVHTYTSTEDDLNDSGLLAPGTENEVRMCLDPGAIFSGGTMAVVIKARASSQNAVTTETTGC